MPNNKPFFITVEGVEGVGKTTNISFIENWLTENRLDFISTREPGGTKLGEDIRHLLLTPRNESVDEIAELLMIFAARAQHLSAVINPALEAKKLVLCDRFTDATFAYQGAARGLGADKVALLENMVQAQLRPDLTLILDLPVEIGMQRASKRGELDRFEQEKLSFFETVRSCYLELASQTPSRYKVIDASQTLDKVQADIEQVLVSALL